MAQLLLVEDDILLGQAVKSALEQDGPAVAAWTCVPDSGRHGTLPSSFSPPTTPTKMWSGDSRWAGTTM